MLERFKDTPRKDRAEGKPVLQHMQERDNDNNNNVLVCILSAHYVTQD